MASRIYTGPPFMFSSSLFAGAIFHRKCGTHFSLRKVPRTVSQSRSALQSAARPRNGGGGVAAGSDVRDLSRARSRDRARVRRSRRDRDSSSSSSGRNRRIRNAKKLLRDLSPTYRCMEKDAQQREEDELLQKQGAALAAGMATTFDEALAGRRE